MFLLHSVVYLRIHTTSKHFDGSLSWTQSKYEFRLLDFGNLQVRVVRDRNVQVPGDKMAEPCTSLKLDKQIFVSLKKKEQIGQNVSDTENKMYLLDRSEY